MHVTFNGSKMFNLKIALYSYLIFFFCQKDMTLKPHERRQNQAGPLRKKKPGRVPNGLSLDLHKDRLNHNNHQHHHSDQENNPRLAHTHSKKKKHLQKKHRPVSLTSSHYVSRSHKCYLFKQELGALMYLINFVARPLV